MSFKFFLYRLRQISPASPSPSVSALPPGAVCRVAFAAGGDQPHRYHVLRLALLVTVLHCLLSVAACQRGKEPFTAEQRFFVDSVSGLRIRQAQAEIDSLCKQKETTEVPRLADSLYRVRKAQMEEKLREFKRGF